MGYEVKKVKPKMPVLIAVLNAVGIPGRFLATPIVAPATAPSVAVMKIVRN